MKLNVKTPALATLLLFFSTLAPAEGPEILSAERAGLSTARLARLDQSMQAYVDRNEVAGVVVLLARKGKIVHLKSFGMADAEAGIDMKNDTMFRIASMTKAITSVAMLMLYEEGKFLLDDPVSGYIPEFKDPQVLVVHKPEDNKPEPYTLEPARSEITIRHLLNHTAGITYGFWGEPYISEMYRKAGISDGISQTNGTIGAMVKKLAQLPLVNHPGEQWHYGLNTDVAGYLVEYFSGQTLAEFFQQRIFQPLGMKDSYFFLPANKVDRLAGVYVPRAGGGIEKLPDELQTDGPVIYSASYHYKGPRTYYSGGGGLVSTAEDYYRFLQMLLNQGELGGKRLLGRKTVELLNSNQIGDLNIFNKGYKFGLGLALHEGPAVSGRIGSTGEFRWGGFFNTGFWVDPHEDFIFIILTQTRRIVTDIQDKFRVLAYQAITD